MIILRSQFEVADGITPDPKDESTVILIEDSSDDDKPLREYNNVKIAQRKYKDRIKAYKSKIITHMNEYDNEDFNDP